MIKLNNKEVWKNLSQLDNSLHRMMLMSIPDDEKILKFNKLQRDYMNSVIKLLGLEHEKWFNDLKVKKAKQSCVVAVNDEKLYDTQY